MKEERQKEGEKERDNKKEKYQRKERDIYIDGG